MGGRTGIASSQALASAFHDNGPGIGASEIFLFALDAPTLARERCSSFFLTADDKGTRMGAACGREPRFSSFVPDSVSQQHRLEVHTRALSGVQFKI
jgi:hypothetical protein